MVRTKASSHSPAAAAATAAPSFLVYPVPSIADETFLQLLFRDKVRRSLFFGFGRNRMAIAELISDDVAQEVERVLRSDGAATPESRPAARYAVKKKGEAQEEEVDAPQQQQQQPDEDDAVNVEEMTLADMFAAPAEDAAPVDARAAAAATAVAVSSSDSFDHLPFLAYRGRPVHVVVSGVRVADFFASGGVVPEKHENKAERSSSKKKLKKIAAAVEKRQREAEAGAAAGADATADVGGEDNAVAKFPKNACQKCGSASHFTRHCDGSGPSTAEVVASADAPAVSEDSGKRASASLATSSSSPAAPAAAPVRVRFPKECCQKCGSATHFTRHCDGSGAAPAATTVPEAAPTAQQQQQQQPTPKEAPREVTAVAPPAPAVVKSKPVVPQRTSKDQCKFCGSDAHLSRHCPNK